MRNSKISRAVSAVTMTLALTGIARADFSYNFDTLTGSGTPGTPLTTAAIGTLTPGPNQDNWILTSGLASQVRNDAPTNYAAIPPAFSGNYLHSTVSSTGAPGTDSISSRAGANFGLSGRYATFQFDGLVGQAGYTNTATPPVQQYRRNVLAPGIDGNLDGDIRANVNAASLTTENTEVAFQFGYEATGSGWYLRRAAYSNTSTIVAATTASGVYRMQLVVDFAANPSTVVDSINGGFVNDGAGSLYVKQIADAAGNPVSDVFRLADPSTSNVSLGLSAMGGFGAANPANWNGISARTSNNGAMDNIVFTAGLPTTSSIWAANAGSWLSPGNWYLAVPNAVDAEADFTAGAKVDSTVYADSAVTVGKIVFNNTSSYVIAGAGSLTLQSATSGLVDVQAGNHKINIPLLVASNTTLNVASGASLKISDPVTIAGGKSLSQSGSGVVTYESTITVQPAASLAIGNSTYAHSLTLQGASTATVTTHTGGSPTVLHLDALSINAGSTLDLKNNELLVPSSLSTIRSQIISGAISSSSATSKQNLGYADAGSGNVEVLYTLLGDTNLDTLVNSTDFNAFVAGYGKTTGANWVDGDFDYNGKVNTLDFNSLAGNFGAVLTSPTPGGTLGSVVPEPGSIGAITIAAATLLCRRKHA